MRKNVKRAVALFLCVWSLISLAACGGKTDAPSSGGSPDAPASTGESGNSANSPAASSDPMDYANAGIDWRQCEGQSIRVIFNQHFFTDGIQKMLPAFEELTGIKVNLEVYPEGEYYNKMLIELNGGAAPPDAFMLDYATVVQYEEGGWVEDINPYIQNAALTDSAWYDFDDFMPSALELGRVGSDPALYGLPVTGEWEILYYRKDLYEEKGLEVPATFDELYENAMALNDNGVSGFVARCARNSALFWPWAGFLRSYGGWWVDPDGQPQLNSEATMAATDMYAKLLRDTGPQGVVNYTWYEALTDFQQGKAAHFIDSSGFMANVEDPENSTVAGNVGYALLPAAKAGETSTPNLAHWMVGMGKDSTHKEAAYLFLQWATCKKVALQIAIDNGTAARSSLWNDAQFTGAYPEQWAQVSLESSKNASKSCLNLLSEVWEMGEVLEIAVNEIYGGRATADAMEECQNRTKDILGLQ